MLTRCKIDYSWEAHLAAEHPYISECSEGVCEKSVKIRTVIIRYSLSYVGKSYLSFIVFIILHLPNLQDCKGFHIFLLETFVTVCG